MPSGCDITVVLDSAVSAARAVLAKRAGTTIIVLDPSLTEEQREALITELTDELARL